MRLSDRFNGLGNQVLRQADRLAQMRTSQINAVRTAGAETASGTVPGSVLYVGRWGITAWGEYRWR